MCSRRSLAIYPRSGIHSNQLGLEQSITGWIFRKGVRKIKSIRGLGYMPQLPTPTLVMTARMKWVYKNTPEIETSRQMQMKF